MPSSPNVQNKISPNPPLTKGGGGDLLRFTTAGSVDDGKSTLIGRLLYDSKSIFEDQLLAIQRTTEKRREDELNLALLTDGLAAEREQGITIDVAYRYFSTPARKFIIADTPGHEQYTRNMVTGASTAQLALILIDARKGLLPQSRRHAIISSLLGIPHVIVCVNKMDLVDYDAEVFKKIETDFKTFAQKLSIPDLRFIPVSALRGGNVVEKSHHMPWYIGKALLQTLETIEVSEDYNRNDLRYPIQLVIRPHLDYRGYAGQVASGEIHVGQEIVSLPSGKHSRIKSIDSFDGPLPIAFYPQSVVVTLTDEIDVSRGDVLVDREHLPKVDKNIEATLCWMSDVPLELNKKYLIKHNCRLVKVVVSDVLFRLNINTLDHEKAGGLHLNEIGQVRLKTLQPLIHDSYAKNRSTGSFIVIDELDNHTLAAGMIV